jgi:hypothetical protein
VRNKWIWLAGVGVTFGLMTGCGNFRKNLAKQMGVKVVTKRIETKDLGGKYKKLHRSEWDFMAPPKSKGKSITKRRGKKKVKTKAKLPKKRANIKYKHFGVKGVDDFNRSANLLYAQYVFADRVLGKTHTDLSKFLKVDTRRVKSKELARAVARWKSDELGGVRSAKHSKTNVELALRGLNNIVDRASKMQGAGNKLVSSTPGQMAADPGRALYADQAVSELTSSLKKVQKVIKGSPKLLKKLTGTKKLVTGLF